MSSHVTVARVCQDKWPRLMPVSWAAGYCGMTIYRLQSIPELMALAHDVAGVQLIDKQDLDRWIDENKAKQLLEQGAAAKC